MRETDKLVVLRPYKELRENRPILYRSWPFQLPVLIGQGLDGTRHFVEKNGDLWRYIQEEKNGVRFELAVWGKWPAYDREIELCDEFMPGGNYYPQLRIATGEDFNGEL